MIVASIFGEIADIYDKGIVDAGKNSLPFLVAASQIGVELGKIGTATAAALIAAGVLSVVGFPAVAPTLLPGRRVADLRPASVETEGL